MDNNNPYNNNAIVRISEDRSSIIYNGNAFHVFLGIGINLIITIC